MSKFIIDNQSFLNDELALDAVSTVVQKGKISNDGKSYCYVSVLRYYRNKKSNQVVVHVLENEKSTRFLILDY